MYIPAANAVSDPDELEAMLRGLRLGCLVTHGPEGLFASHLPMLFDAGRATLAGHLARANPHRERAGDGAEALVIFQGPEAYVSPSWYPSKREHGRVVPTWNYEVVHIHGQLTWIDDDAWLEAHLAALADHFEATLPEPWAVSDAPADYLQGLRRGIVGVELQIDRIEPKRKLSQNRPEAEREGVVAGLAASGDLRDQEVAAAMRGPAAKPPF
jgi:transcriptional regulator